MSKALSVYVKGRKHGRRGRVGTNIKALERKGNLQLVGHVKDRVLVSGAVLKFPFDTVGAV